MRIVSSVFPTLSGAIVQVGNHGQDAAGYLAAAAKAGTGTARLDAALRALVSLDHVVDASRDVPLKWAVPSVRRYYMGYDAAKQAVDLLLASGAIPNANARVGLQDLYAARDYVVRGSASTQADTSRFGRYRSVDLLDAALEDAGRGVKLLDAGRNGDAAMRLIADLRTTADRKQVINPQDSTRAIQLLDGVIRDALSQTSRSGNSRVEQRIDDAALTALLQQAEQSVRAANAALPSVTVDHSAASA